MKNSKKLLALVLVILSCLSLVACASAPAASPAATKEASADAETAAPAESEQTPAEESKGDVKLSIVMLGYNDTQIEAA